jgi:hypothetical protein
MRDAQGWPSDLGSFGGRGGAEHQNCPPATEATQSTISEDIVHLGGKLSGVEHIGEDGKASLTEAPKVEVVQDDARIARAGHVFMMH